MKLIQTIINSLDSMKSVVAVVKALLAGIETFTTELKKAQETDK